MFERQQHPMPGGYGKQLRRHMQRTVLWPAGQCFIAHDLAIRQIDDRLKHRLDLFIADNPQQFILQGPLLD